MSNNNHKANQANSNPHTKGTNNAYKKVQDNKSVQLNPNNTKGTKGK